MKMMILEKSHHRRLPLNGCVVSDPFRPTSFTPFSLLLQLYF